MRIDPWQSTSGGATSGARAIRAATREVAIISEYYGAPMASLADVVVRRLADAGVRTLFGVPGGGSSLDLIDAARRAGLPFVLTATETAAAIAALAQSEITGRPGACLTALGPGASSVANGVACAHLDRAPLIVFTDGLPGASQDRFEHQRLTLNALFQPIAKCSSRFETATALSTLERSLKTAEAGCPGPVHLEWPSDVTTAAGATGGTGATRVATAIPVASTTRQENIVAGSRSRDFEPLLRNARRPLVIAGLGARRVEDAVAIRSLCERRGIPAMVTYKAKGVVPDSHPLFAGVFTNAAIEQPLLREADLVLGVGLDPVELLPRPWTVSAPVVYCGRWPVADDHVPFALQLIAEIGAALDELERSMSPPDWSREEVQEHAARQRRLASVPAPGLSAQRVIEIAARRLAATCRVTVDAGAHMFPATTFWPVGAPGEMLISNGLSTMGFALPAAIGASLLDGNRPVVALTGDGGLLMCAGELLTAARERLRIIVIVFDDASLSLIEIKQQAKRFGPAGVALAPIDWPALARSLGVAAFGAGTESDLERAIDGALACEGPSLIAARIDRTNYAETVRAIRGQI
jgi:acetolactate synthase-1/2/3 large subunit